MKTYLVGIDWNRLSEAIPMSTHKICFGAETTEIIPKSSPQLSRTIIEPGSGHMWESQVLLTDGQVVFLPVLRFSPTFDERSARYK